MSVLGTLGVVLCAGCLSAVFASRLAEDASTQLAESEAGDLPDGLHPSADAYVRMGHRFAAAAFAPGAVLDPRRQALAQGRP